MPAPALAFIDCETTGLDPDRHEVWEVALILDPLPDPEGKADGAREGEWLWQLPVDLAAADPIALNICHFHDRRWTDPVSWGYPGAAQAAGAVHGGEPERRVRGVPRRGDGASMRAWAEQFAQLTWGAHVIGMVPSFDTERLARLLRRWGACPGWHYQPIDVETLAAGILAAGIECAEAFRLPWDSEALSRALGVEPPGGQERHSALADARWAQRLWHAVMGDDEASSR